MSHSDNPSNLQRAARNCQDHLAAERQSLEHSLRGLQRVREALLLSDSEKLTAALAQQQESVRTAEGMSGRRETLRPALAAVLGVPEEAATISLLLQQIGEPEKTELTAAREETARLSRAVAELARGNALMIRSQTLVIQEVLAAITGSDSADQRYGASGQIEGSRRESMIEVRF